MKRIEIENWARTAVEASMTGETPDEDSGIEFKRELIKPKDAAKRIAGLANAARGENVMWVVGFDDEAKEVCTTSREDLSSWWPKVQRAFDLVSPDMKDVVVPIDGLGNVLALMFHTDNAPFVTRDKDGKYEVPWRDGTRVREIRRADLLRMLVPLSQRPVFRVVAGNIQKETETHGGALGCEMIGFCSTGQSAAILADEIEVVCRDGEHEETVAIELWHEKKSASSLQIDGLTAFDLRHSGLEVPFTNDVEVGVGLRLLPTNEEIWVWETFTGPDDTSPLDVRSLYAEEAT